MTLQEVRKKLNDPNLTLEYKMEIKMPRGNSNPFPKILTNYKIKTKANLLIKRGQNTYSITNDAMEQQGFSDVNSFLLYGDKTCIISCILEGIGYHYEDCQMTKIQRELKV